MGENRKQNNTTKDSNLRGPRKNELEKLENFQQQKQQWPQETRSNKNSNKETNKRLKRQIAHDIRRTKEEWVGNVKEPVEEKYHWSQKTPRKIFR